ncbi:MAG: type II toxin-antitoxin system prevent-host-death family antitoxin [Actinomycetota bacterium]
MEVGIRELKNGLSRYLKRVQKGESVVVTQHGRPVARIVPVGVSEHLEQLMSDARVTWSGRRFRPPSNAPRPKPGHPVSDYVGEDRR